MELAIGAQVMDDVKKDYKKAIEDIKTMIVTFSPLPDADF